jgi:hypothetical protein
MTFDEAILLQTEVEEILKTATEHRQEIGGAVNWADLHCKDVEEHRSLLFGYVSIVVVIEEASPDAIELRKFIYAHLEKRGYKSVFVETEW